MRQMVCIRCNDRYEAVSETYCLCPECFETLHRCMGITAKGEQCKNYHSNVHGYCSKHKKGHETEQTHAATYRLMEAFMYGYRIAQERYLEPYLDSLRSAEPKTYSASNWLRELVEAEE